MTHSTPLPELHPAVREVRDEDLGAIRQLILDLAEYEKALDQAKVTEDQLRAAIFGPNPSVFGLVAVTPEADQEIAGFALYFLNFSTWEGVNGIYLEDLFVRPEHRGTGLGKALLQSLAAIAVDRGYARFEWSVLDWNQPSIDFYRSLGARPMDGWSVYRLEGDALDGLGHSLPPRAADSTSD